MIGKTAKLDNISCRKHTKDYIWTNEQWFCQINKVESEFYWYIFSLWQGRQLQFKGQLWQRASVSVYTYCTGYTATKLLNIVQRLTLTFLLPNLIPEKCPIVFSKSGHCVLLKFHVQDMVSYRSWKLCETLQMHLRTYTDVKEPGWPSESLRIQKHTDMADT